MLNQSEWNNLHKQGRFRPRYPEDDIVRWVFQNFERGKNLKILDDGCGAGRHVMFLAENGYVPYGIDYSLEGVKYTKSLLAAANRVDLAKNIINASCDKLPFEDGSFDGVISFGVLYYLEEDGIKDAVNEIVRVLKPGGKAVVVVRSTEDYRCTKGSDNNSNIINDNNDAHSAKAENGMRLHFFTVEEINMLFKDFSEIEINRIIRTHDHGTICCNDFIVTLSK